MNCSEELKNMGNSYSATSMAALLLILIHFSTLVNSSFAIRKILQTQTNTEFIKTSCDTTTDPDLCFTTFSDYASEIQANPESLATTALSITLNTTRSTSKLIVKLSKTHGLKPEETAAIRDCVEEVKDSVDELKRSLGEMRSAAGGKSFELRMSDIQTWVSAALTDEDTCMDGFSEKDVDGNVKAAVRKQIVKVSHLTSIALAFINRYAETHKS